MSLSRWYSYVECVAEDKMVMRTYRSTVEGTKEKGRLRKRWIDIVRELIWARGISDEDVRGMMVSDAFCVWRWYK